MFCLYIHIIQYSTIHYNTTCISLLASISLEILPSLKTIMLSVDVINLNLRFSKPGS